MGRKKIIIKEAKAGRGKPHKEKQRRIEDYESSIKTQQELGVKEKEKKEKKCSDCYENKIKFYECYQCGCVRCDDCLYKNDCGDVLDWGNFNKGKVVCIDCLVDNTQRMYRMEKLVRNGEYVNKFVTEFSKQRGKKK